MKILALISFLLLCLQGASQKEIFFDISLHGVFTGFPPGSQASNLINPNWLTEASNSGADINLYPGVKGTPFFKTDWDKGYILFSDNIIVKNDSISFNVYTNEIFFLMNNKAMV